VGYACVVKWFWRIKDAVSGAWSRLRRKRPSVDHTARAWRRLQDTNGNQYAGAITYFSFLALFPLILLGVAIAGFVLHSHPDTLQELLDNVTRNVPGQLGDTLNTSIKTAIDARTGVGIVGLVGVAFTGLGWIGNLRAAVEAVWQVRPADQNFLIAKVKNLLVLAGLGLGLILSLALTAIGTSLTDQILAALSWDDLPGVHGLVKVLGVLLAICGDLIIFSWLLVRLPGVSVPARVVFKGALLAAVGFEVLKIVGTYTIAHTASSPTAGPFASVVAVLIWIQLVARYMLFCAAWTAVLTGERAQLVPATSAAVAVDSDAVGSDATDVPPAVSPAAVGVALVGVGAVAGAAAATWALARTHRPTA
jgi:membrane protein